MIVEMQIYNKVLNNYIYPFPKPPIIPTLSENSQNNSVHSHFHNKVYLWLNSMLLVCVCGIKKIKNKNNNNNNNNVVLKFSKDRMFNTSYIKINHYNSSTVLFF